MKPFFKRARSKELARSYDVSYGTIPGLGVRRWLNDNCRLD